MKDNNPRTHKILDKLPIFGSILATGIFVALFFIIMSIADLVFEAFLPADLCSGPAILTAFIITTLLFMFWFRGETKGLWLGGDIKGAVTVTIMYIVYWILSVTLGIVISGDRYGFPKLADINNAVSAGFMEETMIRGFILMLLFRKKRTPRMIITSMIVTSVIFAMLHIPNLFVGADPGATVMQVASSIATGFCFAMLYVCSGNIIPAIVIHILHDIIAFSALDATEGGVMVAAVDAGSWVNLLLCYILAAICFFYLKKENIMNRTIEIWDKKWTTTP